MDRWRSNDLSKAAQLVGGKPRARKPLSEQTTITQNDT